MTFFYTHIHSKTYNIWLHFFISQSLLGYIMNNWTETVYSNNLCWTVNNLSRLSKPNFSFGKPLLLAERSKGSCFNLIKKLCFKNDTFLFSLIWHWYFQHNLIVLLKFPWIFRLEKSALNFILYLNRLSLSKRVTLCNRIPPNLIKLKTWQCWPFSMSLLCCLTSKSAMQHGWSMWVQESQLLL